jgi:hypothetical protein
VSEKLAAELTEQLTALRAEMAELQVRFVFPVLHVSLKLELCAGRRKLCQGSSCKAHPEARQPASGQQRAHSRRVTLVYVVQKLVFRALLWVERPR